MIRSIRKAKPITKAIATKLLRRYHNYTFPVVFNFDFKREYTLFCGEDTAAVVTSAAGTTLFSLFCALGARLEPEQVELSQKSEKLPNHSNNCK